MKCPKCGYISFDHNQACPKCSKDISTEQAKLNILPFEPSPLSLLGALTGQVNESQVGLRVDPTSILEESLPQGIPGMDDTSIEDTGHFSFDDAEDTGLDFEDEGAQDAFGEAEEEKAEIDVLDESALVEDESVAGLDLGAGEEEISLEETGGDLSLEPDEDFSLDLVDFSEDEEAEPAQKPEVEFGDIGAEDLTLELSRASIDESVFSGAQDLEEPALEESKTGFDLGDLGTGLEEAGEAEEAEGTASGLDEISVEEPSKEPELDLGDLGLEAETGPEAQDTELKVDEIFLEETPATAESDKSVSAKLESDTGIDLEALDELDIGAEEIEMASDEQDEIELNLEDLKVNETGELEIGAVEPEPLEMEEAEEPEEILLEEQGRDQKQEPMVDVEFEGPPPEETTKIEKPPGAVAQGLEDTLLELEEISLSEEPLVESGESEMTFDLEDLDLDLEFEDEPGDDKQEK